MWELSIIGWCAKESCCGASPHAMGFANSKEALILNVLCTYYIYESTPNWVQNQFEGDDMDSFQVQKLYPSSFCLILV